MLCCSHRTRLHLVLEHHRGEDLPMTCIHFPSLSEKPVKSGKTRKIIFAEPDIAALQAELVRS